MSRTSGFHHRLIAFVFGVVRDSTPTGRSACACWAWPRRPHAGRLVPARRLDRPGPAVQQQRPVLPRLPGLHQGVPREPGRVRHRPGPPPRPPAGGRLGGMAVADAIAAKLAADTDNVRTVEGHVPVDRPRPPGAAVRATTRQRGAPPGQAGPRAAGAVGQAVGREARLPARPARADADPPRPLGVQAGPGRQGRRRAGPVPDAAEPVVGQGDGHARAGRCRSATKCPTWPPRRRTRRGRRGTAYIPDPDDPKPTTCCW